MGLASGVVQLGFTLSCGSAFASSQDGAMSAYFQIIYGALSAFYVWGSAFLYPQRQRFHLIGGIGTLLFDSVCAFFVDSATGVQNDGALLAVCVIVPLSKVLAVAAQYVFQHENHLRNMSTFVYSKVED